MKNEKKKKSKPNNKATEKTTEKSADEKQQETKQKQEKDEGPRVKGIKLLDKLFEEKSAEEILTLSQKHDVMGLGPLSMVAAMGHVTGVRKLLEAGVAVNEPSSMDGETPLTLSARSKHVEVVELLLQHGGDITKTNNDGDNAFMIAIKVGDPKVVNAMWAYRGKLNVNHRNKNAITALHYAAERGWESCVQFLAMQGADVNAKDSSGSSPLIVASIRGDQRTVEALLKAGCNVLTEDNAGCTALCRALQADKTALTEFFVKKLTDIQADNFVKTRSDRLRKPEIPNPEVGYYYNHVLFPMFEELSKYENYRELLFRHKIIPHAILAVGRFVNDPETMAAVCQIFSVLMYHYPTFVEERFALQFIRSGGPELIVRALKSFSDSKLANPSLQEEGVCFLPLLAACEVSIGREWLQRNSLKVMQFTRNFEVSLETIDFPDDGSRLKARVLWSRFRDFFDGMIKSQCEQQEAELLEGEEREKVRKEKKREKKRQRRQRQNQLKQDQTSDTDQQVELTEGSVFLSGPILGDSDTDEDETKEDMGIKTVSMESFVDKMKSYFANPVDQDESSIGDSTEMQQSENNTKSTEEKKLPDKAISGLLQISSKEVFSTEGNINASCAEKGTEKEDVSGQSSNAPSERAHNGLSGHNDIQEDGLYATEGFYDPTAILADLIPGESSWVTVGAKKNTQRGSETSIQDASSNVKKKQKKKKKSDDHVPSSTFANTGNTTLTAQTNGNSNKCNVWAPKYEDWESEMSGFLQTQANLNYEDEFPSLGANPTQKTKRQGRASNASNEAQNSALCHSRCGNQYNDRDDDQSSGSGDSVSTIDEGEVCGQGDVSDWFDYNGDFEDDPVAEVEAYLLKEGTEAPTGAACRNNNEKAQQTLARIAETLAEKEKQANDGNPTIPAATNVKNECLERSSDSHFAASLQNNIPLDRNITYCVENEIVSPGATETTDVLPYWQDNQHQLTAPSSVKGVNILSESANIGSREETLPAGAQAAKTAHPWNNQQFRTDRAKLAAQLAFANVQSHIRPPTYNIRPPPGLGQMGRQPLLAINNPMSMDGCHVPNTVWQQDQAQTASTHTHLQNGGYPAPPRMDHQPDVTNVNQSPNQPPMNNYFTQNQQANIARVTAGNVPKQQEPLDMSFHGANQNASEVSTSVYPTQEAIQHATKLCVQQIAALAGLRHQRAILDAQAQNFQRMDAQQTTQVPKVDAQQNPQTPRVDARETTQIPRFDAQQNSQIPRMNARQNLQMPRMDAHQNPQIPKVDSQQAPQFPTLDAQRPSNPFDNAYQRVLQTNYGVQPDNDTFLKTTFPQSWKQGLSTFDQPAVQESPPYARFNEEEEKCDEENSPKTHAESYFPSFHTPLPEAWPFAKQAPNMNPLDVLRLEQIRQWRRQLGDGFKDNPLFNDYHYFYSSLSQQAKAVLDDEFGPTSVGGMFNILNSKVPSASATNTSPTKTDPVDKSKSQTNVGNDVTSPTREQKVSACTVYNGVNWIPKSPRWRNQLQEMLEFPQQYCRLVGCIRIPNDVDKYSLRQGNNKTTLGLLSDGREVAVSRIRVDQISEIYHDLNGLLAGDIDDLFLVKYLAVEQKNQFCYVATELCEYTIEEYINILHLNRRLDPLSADRLVWQMMKGLKHLHDNCKILHHNLRPNNILIDTTGKVKIADYGQKNSIQPRTSSQTIPDRDSRCWQACEVLVSNSDACYSVRSDIQVAGMLTYYILSGGSHAFGKSACEIETNICRNWHQLIYISEEANDMILSMLSYTPLTRPTVSEALRHPYFWSEEKRFRFLLIVGSDILKELSSGSSVTDHINIIYAPAISTDWIAEIDAELVQEMSQVRQYRNSIPDLVLFLYNCCLHFDKLSTGTHDILDDPCKYFNTKFPALFMAVYRILRTSETVTARNCYKSFF